MHVGDALFAGQDGLQAYLSIAHTFTQCEAQRPLLKNGAYLVLEVSSKKAAAVKEIFCPTLAQSFQRKSKKHAKHGGKSTSTSSRSGHWDYIETATDWKGYERCLVLRWRAGTMTAGPTKSSGIDNTFAGHREGSIPDRDRKKKRKFGYLMSMSEGFGGANNLNINKQKKKKKKKKK